MGNLRTGLASQLTSPVAEVTYGVAPSLAAAKFSAFTSEGLGLKKNTQQGIGLLAGNLYPVAARRVVTDWAVGGPVTMDLPARGLQQWLFPMFGSYGTTASALTQDASTGAYKAVHAPGPLEGNSFCVQKGVPAVDTGAVEPFTYTGCKISDWEIPAVKKGEIVKLSLTIDARNELGGNGNSDPLNVSVPGLVTYTAPPAGGVFHFRQASVFTGGTVSTTSGVTTVSSPVLAGNIREISIKQGVPMDVERFNLGLSGFKAEQLQNALRPVTGQMVVEWLAAESYYNAFVADTPTVLQLSLVGPAIGTGSDFSTLSLLVSDVFWDTDISPKVGGPDIVMQTIPFVGLSDGTNNVIQATYWTLDSA